MSDDGNEFTSLEDGLDGEHDENLAQIETDVSDFYQHMNKQNLMDIRLIGDSRYSLPPGWGWRFYEPQHRHIPTYLGEGYDTHHYRILFQDMIIRQIENWKYNAHTFFGIRPHRHLVAFGKKTRHSKRKSNKTNKRRKSKGLFW